MFKMVAEVIIMREEEKKRTSQKSGIRRILSKRWALPAIYLVSAAILLTAVLWYQTSNNNNATEPGKVGYEENGTASKNKDEKAVEVNSKLENFIKPVSNQDDMIVKTPFYDVNGEEADQEKALVFYDNQYRLNHGIDVAMKDGKSFDVLTAVSGKVTQVKEDSLLGNSIEVEHGDGITTLYQSVTDIAVKVGDTVKQGQPLAKAGQSLLNKDAGIHVHFEIRKDNIAVNPESYFKKPVTALKDAEVVNGTPKDEKSVSEDESTKEKSSKDSNTKAE